MIRGVKPVGGVKWLVIIEIKSSYRFKPFSDLGSPEVRLFVQLCRHVS